MSIFIAEDFYIKCNKCGCKTLVKAEIFNSECCSSTIERPMGECTNYYYYGEVCCESCNSEIDYYISSEEYPVNAFNFAIHECTGGEFVNEPKWEVSCGDEDDWYEAP